MWGPCYAERSLLYTRVLGLSFNKKEQFRNFRYKPRTKTAFLGPVLAGPLCWLCERVRVHAGRDERCNGEMAMPKRMWTAILIAALIAFGTLAWNLTARAAYESAEYTVISSDGSFEVREYSDLMLVATSTSSDDQGRDGSFMKLFRYISGANEAQQKIAMTTPVFVENNQAGSSVQMGFVMPKQVAVEGIPAPKGSDLGVRKRAGGRFAAYRFAGRMDATMAKESEAKLRDWMKIKGLVAAEDEQVETAVYDAPFTPGPMRRNEVLIRLK